MSVTDLPLHDTALPPGCSEAEISQRFGGYSPRQERKALDRILDDIDRAPSALPAKVRLLPGTRMTRIERGDARSSLFALEDFLGDMDAADEVENRDWPALPSDPALIMDLADGRVVGVRCLMGYDAKPFHFVGVWPDRQQFDAAMAVEAEAARTDEERARFDMAVDADPDGLG